MRVVESIMQSFVLSGIAYIKPAAMHRYSEDKELIPYINLGIMLNEFLTKSSEYGEKVAKGKLSAPQVPLGKLLADAMRHLGGKYTSSPIFFDSIVSSITLACASSHAIAQHKEAVNEGLIGKSINLFLTSSVGKDVVELLRIVKLIGPREYVSLISESGLTETRITLENISLYELLFSLSARSPSLRYLTRFSVAEALIRIMKSSFKEIPDANNAVVSSYISLIKELKLPTWARENIEKAEKQGLMKSRDSARLLFEIDRKLRKERKNFNNYVPIITLTTAISLILGYISI